MTFDRKIFHSKIARRIFVLFVSCALVPILCLSVISYIRVSKQLHDQSFKLLKQSVTGYAYSIYERLIFLDTELQIIASSINASLNAPEQTPLAGLNKRLASRFKAVALFNPVDGSIPVYKTMNTFKKPSVKEIKHINAGKTAVFIINHPGRLPIIGMMRAVDPRNQKAGYLVGEINPSYLWGIDQGNSLPPGTEVCVLDGSKNLIFTSYSSEEPFIRNSDFQFIDSVSGQFGSVIQNEEYLAGYRKIFLNRLFLIDEWIVVLSESKDQVLAPMSEFKQIFPAVILVAFWAVLILSIYHIRKSLTPLDLLKKRTRQIAVQNFEDQVNLTSGDEFEELGNDFNKMSTELKKQFKNLDTRAEIDRAILSSLDTSVIVETIVHRIYDWFVCDGVGAALMDSDQGKTAQVYYNSYDKRTELFNTSVEMSPYDLDMLNDHPEYFIADDDANRLSFLSALIEQGNQSFLILPVFFKKTLKAIIMIGRSQIKAFNIEEFIQARQMADQIAVALSNASLIRELEQLNWGTIKALARTVDAKSSWTAGHSTRVTKMALKIGSIMGLPPEQLDDLHRAALLHDIGKVGIPVSILDKPGALDDEEYNIIKKHPYIGARILEPITSYSNIIPMILQHHERFDGKGYPYGLSGDEIVIGARILGLSDVFDALVSDRPYRKGWPVERVIDYITEEAGRQFDPDIVETFLTIARQKKTKAA